MHAKHIYEYLYAYMCEYVVVTLGRILRMALPSNYKQDRYAQARLWAEYVQWRSKKY